MSLVVSAAPRLANPPPALSVATGLRQSQGGEETWSPRSLPGLALWLDAAKGITLNGTTVSAWADQSGHGNHVTQTATTSKQPTYRAANDQLNGWPSLRSFNAAQTVMLGAVGSRPVASGAARTVVAMLRPTTSTNNTIINFECNGQDWAYLALSFGPFIFGTATTNLFVTAPAYPDVTNLPLYTVHTSGAAPGGSVAFRANGVAYTGYGGNPIIGEVGPGQFMVFGRQTGTTQCFDGDLAELIVCDGILSASDIALVEAYLASKYISGPHAQTIGPLAGRQPLQWLDAGLGISFSSGSAVVAWADQSGNARHMTQSGTTAQPLLVTTSGIPAVHFDGGDDWLRSTYVRAEPHTIVVFAKYLDGATGSLYDSEAVVNRNRFYRIATAAVSLGNGSQSNVPAADLENWHMHMIVCNGALGTYRQESNAPVAAPSGSPGAADGLVLGSLAGGQYFGHVAIREVFVYAGVLSASEITAMIAYGAAKYP